MAHLRDQPVSVRLCGHRENVAWLADLLEADHDLEVQQRSQPYPNRGGARDQVRVYLDVIQH
ncbi:hypothetical protein RIF23_14710 [Lipingzhangella sp. LS1_29]|uniref:Uncharacterized protein n=1 Tax=Lipingzhangella rawalii TaxID=2055835 RepID=A0ABU2H8E7_9ACTN|nr:hypothetical protein [Lipingzhangella rawalii]MDS1271548.1 hypothetical protein [Lipingzhangella rawalii]